MAAISKPAVQLQVLGPVSVALAGGGDATPLLTQPRRLAVLTYLTLARPRGLHARDTLIALLWPEANHAGGRHALRNVLHAIRLALGDVLVSAGDGLVGVDRMRLVCDALLLEDDVAADRVEEATARYEGEPLQGFHVADAPEFERWLDAERQRLHHIALRAAWRAADEHRVRGDLGGAVRLARRAAALAPDDEPSLRRLIKLLAVAGDPGSALRAYDDFAARLREDCGAEPAADTRSLVRDLRVRRATPADGVRADSLPLHTRSNDSQVPVSREPVPTPPSEASA
ncbi:MAG: transcriptional activator protein [Gemmatimonadetes bacterium]|nr:transcriptional activator protein [Gemmatimonadota bacterium]